MWQKRPTRAFLLSYARKIPRVRTCACMHACAHAPLRHPVVHTQSRVAMSRVTPTAPHPTHHAASPPPHTLVLLLCPLSAILSASSRRAPNPASSHTKRPTKRDLLTMACLVPLDTQSKLQEASNTVAEASREVDERRAEASQVLMQGMLRLCTNACTHTCAHLGRLR